MPVNGNTINYQASQPSHPWSGRTTEFDDALLQRGIVTPQQVFMAKGASEAEAERLARTFQDLKSRQEKDNSNHVIGATDAVAVEVGHGDYDDDEDIEFDDDDEFVQRYRQERFHEMEQQHQQQLSQQHAIIRHITRDEWMTHVNQASMTQKQWVIVALTDPFCHDRVTQELHQIQRLLLQPKNSKVKWVTISATDAISNWPAERVPTLFAYREGVKQHEWIASYTGQWPASLLQLVQEEWRIV
jgi:hypothetical protein